MIQRDEIYLASFPLGDVAGMKLRPVLTLTGQVGSSQEVLVACISSVIPTSLLSSDLILDPASVEHASSNLKTKSAVRLHKLATIHRRSIARRLGALRPSVVAEVNQKLRALLGL